MANTVLVKVRSALGFGGGTTDGFGGTTNSFPNIPTMMSTTSYDSWLDADLDCHICMKFVVYTVGAGPLNKNVDEALMEIVTKATFPICTFVTPTGKVIKFNQPGVTEVDVKHTIDTIEFDIKMNITSEDITIEDVI